jgi:hypothetical protein
MAREDAGESVPSLGRGLPNRMVKICLKYETLNGFGYGNADFETASQSFALQKSMICLYGRVFPLTVPDS